jgi:hypothetical protein
MDDKNIKSPGRKVNAPSQEVTDLNALETGQRKVLQDADAVLDLSDWAAKMQIARRYVSFAYFA